MKPNASPKSAKAKLLAIPLRPASNCQPAKPASAASRSLSLSTAIALPPSPACPYVATDGDGSNLRARRGDDRALGGGGDRAAARDLPPPSRGRRAADRGLCGRRGAR